MMITQHTAKANGRTAPAHSAPNRAYSVTAGDRLGTIC